MKSNSWWKHHHNPVDQLFINHLIVPHHYLLDPFQILEQTIIWNFQAYPFPKNRRSLPAHPYTMLNLVAIVNLKKLCHSNHHSRQQWTLLLAACLSSLCTNHPNSLPIWWIFFIGQNVWNSPHFLSSKFYNTTQQSKTLVLKCGSYLN